MFDRKTILLVYHEPKVRNALTQKLKPNYDLLFAEDGVQAVRVYENHAERMRP